MDGTITSPMLSSLPRGYRNDRQFGLVYDQVPVRADDLTLIAGIATREAVILNRLGIYFIAQIALWRPHELTAFAQELQVSPVQISDERWIEQARSLCHVAVSASRPRRELPASLLRTVSLMICALMLGFGLVYLLGQRHKLPLQGVLSADITSVRVPAAARLIAAHVKPGDEVFTGAALLTLEKSAHIALIEEQQRRVQSLQDDLQQAEAKAELEVSWRIQEVDRELFQAQSQIAAVQEGQRKASEALRTASTVATDKGRLRASPISSSRAQSSAAVPVRAGGLLFFSGESGKSTSISPESGLPPAPVAPRIAQATPMSSAEPVAVLALNHSNTLALENRLERLEALRTALPEQVRQAAGIQQIRLRYDEAAERLEEMKSASREVAVTAPAYGVVGQIRYREGDIMPEGEVMLKILHTDRRYVIVYVPTRRVNELQPGSQVDLVFSGRQHFRGEVTDLPMLADTVVPGSESMAAVRVEPVGKLWPQVPIGSQIDVTVIP